MSKFQHLSHKKVVLQDVLEYLQELLEARQGEVLQSGPAATVEEIRDQLGQVRGIQHCMRRLEYNFGDEPVNEELYDTRY
jgi:hypothetical protein